jgi:hypothetical protein
MKLVQSVALICAAVALAGTAVAQDKPAGKQARTSSKAPTPVQGALSVLPTLTAADQEQLVAASLAYYGPYGCEFNQALSVSKHATDGYVVVTFSSKAYTMKPVRSSTGALRLEEVGNGPMLMVQIPTKSMLMDTVRGRRIVDACVHETQAKEAGADTNALGMNSLPGQVDTSGVAVTQSSTTKR